MALVARQNADLRGVTDAGGNFASQNCGDELVTSGLVKNEGRGRHELAASGEQDDVLQEFQRAGPAAILIIDLAIDVICVSQIDQLRAGIEKAIAPAVKARGRRRAGRLLLALA